MAAKASAVLGRGLSFLRALLGGAWTVAVVLAVLGLVAASSGSCDPDRARYWEDGDVYYEYETYSEDPFLPDSELYSGEHSDLEVYSGEGPPDLDDYILPADEVGSPYEEGYAEACADIFAGGPLRDDGGQVHAEQDCLAGLDEQESEEGGSTGDFLDPTYEPVGEPSEQPG